MADPKVHAQYEKEAAQKAVHPVDLAVSDYFQERNLLESARVWRLKFMYIAG